MLYLILSASFDPTDSEKFIKILKIGYTIDHNENNRFGSYKNHNPSSQVLYKIPFADEQDESNIHGYFKKYRIFGHEWYEYNEEILEYFKTHTTKESLSDLPFVPHQKDKLSLKQERIQVIRSEINSRGVLGNLKSFLEDFYSVSSTFAIRLRSICELSEEDRNIVFDILPEACFRNYYETLGPERCKALGYKKSELEKYLNDLKLNTSDLEERIFSEFTIGSKYTKSEIKQKLGDLYSELGYNKTPKATDLEEYFRLKRCAIAVETGKRSEGFEIIKRK